MNMSTSHPSGPVTPRERPRGQQKVYELGNSVTVSLPQTIGLTPGTALSMRLGWYEDQLLYLKAVPADPAFTTQTDPQPTPMADGGDRVAETSITDPYKVRTGRTPMLTIPAACPDEQFAVGTSPELVAGMVEGSLAYLKVIPETLYAAAGSIALSDLIHALDPDASRDAPEESTQLPLSAFTPSQ